MSGFPEYDRYDALGLAELVRQGEVTPTELCQEAIERIERINPKINAVVTPMYDQGRKTASEVLADTPFAGVPFLLKDLIFAYAGVPTSHGCRSFKNVIPDYDSEMVARSKKPA